MIIIKRVKVKNMHSGDSGGIGWLAKWKKYKGLNDDTHVECRCCQEKEAMHGGHVIKVDSDDKKRYIVPLCVKCNEGKNNTPPFSVDESDLVPITEI